MKKAITLFLIGCTLCMGSSAQQMVSEPINTVNHATLIGVGKAFLTDTYLSPLKYDGISISLLHDRIKASRMIDGRLLLQQQYHIQTAVAKNPTSSATEYYGDIGTQITGFYPLLRSQQFTLLCGGGGDFSLGGIYNVRNSNNPGALKAAFNLQLSATALYQWRSVLLRWQVSSPFIGMFFSPEFGHSYYEIFSLGNNKGTVHFASLHNQLALRNYFTVDIPIRNITLRTGYLGKFYRTDVNQLNTHIFSHQMFVGLAFESIHFGGKRTRNNKAIRSPFYY